jgi:hypothetical protein
MHHDHENAKMIAAGLSELGFVVTPQPVESNIIFVDTANVGITPNELRDALAKKNIKILGSTNSRFRLVTHYQVFALPHSCLAICLGDFSHAFSTTLLFSFEIPRSARSRASLARSWCEK